MDTSIYRAISHFARRTGWLHPPVIAFAKYGIALFGVALLVGWWLGRQRPTTAAIAAVACTAVAVFVALAAAQLVGHIFDRARPYDAIAGAVAGGLWVVDRRLGRVVVGLAVAMAFARVYVGAHYPGDVVAGLVLGAVIAAAVNRLAGRIVAQLLDRLARTALGPLIRSGGAEAERA
ncbi:MAG: phosphatase PAP2 family protein [Actinobacteria bacterium]|nr:phosphatase PAP2 family protein [Actinomycetota bacterium]